MRAWFDAGRQMECVMYRFVVFMCLRVVYGFLSYTCLLAFRFCFCCWETYVDDANSFVFQLLSWLRIDIAHYSLFWRCLQLLLLPKFLYKSDGTCVRSSPHCGPFRLP